MAKIEKKTKRYPSDLTDEEWAKIEPFLPRTAKSGRPIEVDLREVLNAIRYITRRVRAGMADAAGVGPSADAWRKDTGRSRPRSKSSRLHARCELEHQATPSANRTRRSASACTSASSDTLAPFGRLISIAPRLSPRRVGRAGFAATSERGGAEAASNSSSFTGMKAGAPLRRHDHDRLLVRRLAPPIAPALARAPYPFENEIGVHPVPTRDRRDRGARRQSLHDDPLALVVASRSPPLPNSIVRRH
jgi:transposase